VMISLIKNINTISDMGMDKRVNGRIMLQRGKSLSFFSRSPFPFRSIYIYFFHSTPPFVRPIPAGLMAAESWLAPARLIPVICSSPILVLPYLVSLSLSL
jgi:hypothetical protein